MLGSCSRYCAYISRRKPLTTQVGKSELDQSLSLWQLVSLGTGSMVGAGMFVLTGVVAKNYAGPAVTVSYLVAGLASFLAALCYAELASRIPRTGSTYLYVYHTVGELWAFLIGWNMLLEYILCSAATARAFSGYIDGLADHRISDFMISNVGTMEPFADYPDFIACSLVLATLLMVALGASMSATLMNVLVVLTLSAGFAISIAGFALADPSNWSTFAPFGVKGIMAGSAQCFYAFVGFDVIALSAEEARDSRKIPAALGICVVLGMVVYISSAAALTLIVPYYQINVNSAYPDAFKAVGQSWFIYIISIGAIAGIVSSNLGSMFATPRSVYAMAHDGLLFSPLAKIHAGTKVPQIANVVFGIIALTATLLLSLEELAEMVSIGTLASYGGVALSMLILRYNPSSNTNADRKSGENEPILLSPFVNTPVLRTISTFCSALVFIIISAALFTADSCITAFGFDALAAFEWWAWLLFVGTKLLILAALCCLAMHTQFTDETVFKIPFGPTIPSLSIWFNIFLIVQLRVITWLRLFIWVIVGLVIYVLYGFRHSKLRPLGGYQEIEGDTFAKSNNHPKETDESSLTAPGESLSSNGLVDRPNSTPKKLD